MTTTQELYDSIPKDWRVFKPRDLNPRGDVWLKNHTGQWTTDFGCALALTKSEAAGFVDFYGGEAVQV